MQLIESLGWQPRDNETIRCTSCVKSKRECVWLYEDECCESCFLFNEADHCIAFQYHETFLSLSLPHTPLQTKRLTERGSYDLTPRVIGPDSSTLLQKLMAAAAHERLDSEKAYGLLSTPKRKVESTSTSPRRSQKRCRIKPTDATYVPKTSTDQYYEIERILDGTYLRLSSRYPVRYLHFCSSTGRDNGMMYMHIRNQFDLVVRLGRRDRVEYLVKWVGYEHPSDLSVRLPSTSLHIFLDSISSLRQENQIDCVWSVNRPVILLIPSKSGNHYLRCWKGKYTPQTFVRHGVRVGSLTSMNPLC